MERLADERVLPQIVVSDTGTELTRKRYTIITVSSDDARAKGTVLRSDYSSTGVAPHRTRQAGAKHFRSTVKLRDECLIECVFLRLAEKPGRARLGGSTLPAAPELRHRDADRARAA
jgi:hypothetical protein